jgi:hypothetical protein
MEAVDPLSALERELMIAFWERVRYQTRERPDGSRTLAEREVWLDSSVALRVLRRELVPEDFNLEEEA